MNFRGALKTAWSALKSNWLRSLLTILGIVIGIVAIVLVVALGQGAQNLILGEIEGIGANAVIVRPGREPTGPSNAAETLLTDSLKDRDITALLNKKNVPGAVSVDPAVLVPGIVSYQDEVFRPTIFGWTGTALQDIFSITPEEGSFFTKDEINQRAKVAVIGARVKEELFGASDAMGEFIKIRGQNMRVIGVLPERGQVSFLNVDEIVLVPYSTAQKTLMGIDYYHEIFIRAENESDVDLVVKDTENTLREMHGITDPEKDDFFVTTQADALELISTITTTLTLFLVAIASISLVVGGVGIMNIMLVSVTERTREIGLRKAVGATNKDIMLQFLLEAVLLTVGGGILGTSIAIGLAAAVSFVARTQFNLNWPFVLPLGAIALGVGVAASIGLLFGIYPARTAAQKDPIESLRYE